ncbi:MAG: hypothetical protein AAFY26_06485 [Cyanobacteria bacterium J06638_22]
MPFLLTLALVGGYGFGLMKFWKGFDRTNFNQNRLLLSVGWPLFLVNASYRQNFRRALKG